MLLNEHFKRIQRILQEEGHAAKSFSHGLNKGLIREAFIREFLTKNISSIWGVGTGEIIHQESDVQEKRSQIDAIIHDYSHPKLPLAGEIDLFFVETVSTTIEIKSKLKKQDVIKAGNTARIVKQLALESIRIRELTSNRYERLPYPYTILFAYDGPAKIETVLKWVNQLSQESGSDDGLFTLGNSKLEYRLAANQRFIDGIFVLGKGFVVIDAMARSIQADGSFDREQPGSDVPFAYYGKSQELFLLWILINQAIALRSNAEEVFESYIKGIDIFFNGGDV